MKLNKEKMERLSPRPWMHRAVDLACNTPGQVQSGLRWLGRVRLTLKSEREPSRHVAQAIKTKKSQPWWNRLRNPIGPNSSTVEAE